MTDHIAAAVHAMRPKPYDIVLATQIYLNDIPVSIGASYFDCIAPGWWKEVNVEDVTADCTNHNIVALVHRTQLCATIEFQDWTEAQLRAHGFIAAKEVTGACLDLAEQWKNIIRGRRRKGWS